MSVQEKPGQTNRPSFAYVVATGQTVLLFLIQGFSLLHTVSDAGRMGGQPANPVPPIIFVIATAALAIVGTMRS